MHELMHLSCSQACAWISVGQLIWINSSVRIAASSSYQAFPPHVPLQVSAVINLWAQPLLEEPLYSHLQLQLSHSASFLWLMSTNNTPCLCSVYTNNTKLQGWWWQASNCEDLWRANISKEQQMRGERSHTLSNTCTLFKCTMFWFCGPSSGKQWDKETFNTYKGYTSWRGQSDSRSCQAVSPTVCVHLTD